MPQMTLYSYSLMHPRVPRVYRCARTVEAPFSVVLEKRNHVCLHDESYKSKQGQRCLSTSHTKGWLSCRKYLKTSNIRSAAHFPLLLSVSQHLTSPLSRSSTARIRKESSNNPSPRSGVIVRCHKDRPVLHNHINN